MKRKIIIVTVGAVAIAILPAAIRHWGKVSDVEVRPSNIPEARARSRIPPHGPALSITSVITIAGNGTEAPTADYVPANETAVDKPASLAVGPEGNLYILEAQSHRILKVRTDGVVLPFAGNGSSGDPQDGVRAPEAALPAIASIAVNPEGEVYYSDNTRIRKIDRSRKIWTVAGGASTGFSGDGGPAVKALLYYPGEMTFDAAGNLYFTDGGNDRVRKIDRAGSITTLGGNGSRTHSGNGGPALNAGLAQPFGIAVDSKNNIYFTELLSFGAVYQITPDGTLRFFAGSSAGGFSGDGGQALEAQLNSPRGLAVDQDDNLYIADLTNFRIRKIELSGIIRTIAGSGKEGFGGDGGSALQADFGQLPNVAVSASGIFYVADYYNHRVRAFREGM